MVWKVRSTRLSDKGSVFSCNLDLLARAHRPEKAKERRRGSPVIDN